MANPVINPLQKESFSICDKDYLRDKIEIFAVSCSSSQLRYYCLPFAPPSFFFLIAFYLYPKCNQMYIYCKICQFFSFANFWQSVDTYIKKGLLSLILQCLCLAFFPSWAAQLYFLKGLSREWRRALFSSQYVQNLEQLSWCSVGAFFSFSMKLRNTLVYSE